MKIAIFFENQQIQGGAFNYALNILNIFKRNEFQDYQVVLITENKKNYEFFNSKGIEVKLIENNFFVKAYNFLINIKWVKKIFLRFKIYSSLERFLKSENINLIVFPTGSNVPFSLLKTNFVTTLLDICHLEYSLFPEINDDNNFDDKEFFINNCIPKSIFTFTVSNELKHQVEQFYPFLKNKLTVVPLSLNHFDYQKTEEIKNIKEEKDIFAVGCLLKKKGLKIFNFFYVSDKNYFRKNWDKITNIIASELSVYFFSEYVLGDNENIFPDKIFLSKIKKKEIYVKSKNELCNLDLLNSDLVI